MSKKNFYRSPKIYICSCHVTSIYEQYLWMPACSLLGHFVSESEFSNSTLKLSFLGSAWSICVFEILRKRTHRHTDGQTPPKQYHFVTIGGLQVKTTAYWLYAATHKLQVTDIAIMAGKVCVWSVTWLAIYETRRHCCRVKIVSGRQRSNLPKIRWSRC